MNPRAPTPPPAAAHDAEAREFEDFARGQDPLDVAAATWALRRRNGLDAAGEAELADWLQADPRHAEALDDMARGLDDLQHLPDDEIASLKAALTDAPLPETLCPARAPASPMRWWQGLQLNWLPQAALAATVCVLCGSVWLGWQHWQEQPVFAQAYATARGQQLNVALPDAPLQGSSLQLDTASRAEVSLYRDRREVRLSEGQAMFVVHPDASRPFHVWAGGLQITVVGTRFSVRHSAQGQDAGQTVVEVEEGRVRVAPALPGQAAVELVAGQRVAADGHGGLGAVASKSPGAVAPWRSGRVSFDQTPLAQAIAEFERYGSTGLVVRDPAVAVLPVGGSYSLKQHRQFAEALPHLLPVRLVRRGELTEVVAREPEIK